jgi:hypothetical protein
VAAIPGSGKEPSAAVSLARTAGKAALLEQRGCQQQAGHHPGGQLTQPPLGGPALCQDRIDHLERHDLRRLAQMARGENAFGYRDLAGDDTLTGQRSLLS